MLFSFLLDPDPEKVPNPTGYRYVSKHWKIRPSIIAILHLDWPGEGKTRHEGEWERTASWSPLLLRQAEPVRLGDAPARRHIRNRATIQVRVKTLSIEWSTRVMQIHIIWQRSSIYIKYKKKICLRSWSGSRPYLKKRYLSMKKKHIYCITTFEFLLHYLFVGSGSLSFDTDSDPDPILIRIQRNDPADPDPQYWKQERALWSDSFLLLPRDTDDARVLDWIYYTLVPRIQYICNAVILLALPLPGSNYNSSLRSDYVSRNCWLDWIDWLICKGPPAWDPLGCVQSFSPICWVWKSSPCGQVSGGESMAWNKNTV